MNGISWRAFKPCEGTSTEDAEYVSQPLFKWWLNVPEDDPECPMC